MKSVKPGRMSSLMGGIMGIFMVFIGIVWTIIAAQASWFMALFGIGWTGIALIQTIVNFKNAKAKNRHSAYDIVDEQEEPDPMNEKFGAYHQSMPQNRGRFCPYCGDKVYNNFEYCPSCGKKL